MERIWKVRFPATPPCSPFMPPPQTCFILFCAGLSTASKLMASLLAPQPLWRPAPDAVDSDPSPTLAYPGVSFQLHSHADVSSPGPPASPLCLHGRLPNLPKSWVFTHPSDPDSYNSSLIAAEVNVLTWYKNRRSAARAQGACPLKEAHLEFRVLFVLFLM